MLGCSTTLVLEVPRLGSWLDCAWWKCLVSDAGWIVLSCSTALVLEMPRLVSSLDCAGS